MNSPRDKDLEISNRAQRRAPPHGDAHPARPAVPPEETPEKRIRGIFALGDRTPLPRVNKRTLSAYHRYLAARLCFPFLARCWEEVSPLESVSQIVSVIGLVDPADRRAEISAGLRCTARMDDRIVELPLAELELGNGTANSRLVEDYWYWFWNWRTHAGA